MVEPGKTGTLYGIRIKDGKLIAKISMLGTGVSLTRPVALGNKIYFISRKLGKNITWVESYLIEE